MSKSNNGKENILCVGFIVLVFVSLALFWCRFYCKVAIGEVADFPRIAIEPSGLVDDAIENDPNTVPSRVSYRGYRDETMSYSLGVYDYRMKKDRYVGATENYFYQPSAKKNKKGYAVYYDKKLRQFVYCYLHFTGGDDGRWVKKIRYYAGPEGVSKKKDDTIGRFVRPVKVSLRYGGRVFYDEGLKRFFRLDSSGKRQITKKGPDGKEIKEWIDGEISVFMGKPLAEDTWRRPIGSNQMGAGVSVYWQPPRKKAVKDNNNKGKLKIKMGHGGLEEIDVGLNAWSNKFIPVVDVTGRIDLLDRDTLEFVGGKAGYLPAAPEFYGFKRFEGRASPKDLYGFKIIAFSDPNSGEYKGIAVGSSARDLSGTALLVYDAKGRCVSHTNSRRYYERLWHKTDPGYKYITHKETIEFHVMKVAWGPVLVLSKFALESMQGLVFQAGSLVTDAFGPRSWGRSLFFMPDSFLAGRERINMENYLGKYVILFFMLIPGMAISILLGWRVGKSAKAIGLADSARMWWIILTIAFGLSAYITYRFVRPKIALVTCASCGKLRRPDLEKCHHCRSSWQAASPNKPLWRVID